MAPDRKNSLTLKIRSVEREPITWNKADVWSRVASNVSTPHRSYRLFYYAAATLLIASLALLPLLHEKPIPSSSDVQNSLSLTPERERKSATPQAFAVEPAAASGIAPQRVLPIRSAQQQNTVVESSLDTLATSEPPSQVLKVPELVATDEVSLVKDELESAVSVREEKVQPIIGTMETETKLIVTHQKRKRLIRKLETPDQAEADATLTAILLARNK